MLKLQLNDKMFIISYILDQYTETWLEKSWMGRNSFIDWLELIAGYQFHWKLVGYIWIFALFSARC